MRQNSTGEKRPDGKRPGKPAQVAEGGYMKKLLAVFMAVLLGISATCTAWAASLSDVGIVGEQIPSRFLGKEALLTQKFQQAFQ